MPELPEVENVVRSLTSLMQGRVITRITLHRADMLITPKTKPALGIKHLQHQTVTRIIRHGKQFAFITSPSATTTELTANSSNRTSPILAAHLGMTGQFKLHPPNTPYPAHTHLSLDVQDPDQSASPTTIIFRDPRRFGQLRLHHHLQDLYEQQWNVLGPDALLIEPNDLLARLKRTRRQLKAALLDQHLVAGLGNIYVDELLFACRIRPTKRANRVTRQEADRLVQHMRPILEHAIEAGGSTLRDYVNGLGEFGEYQLHHRVYGKPKGAVCEVCEKPLRHAVIAGRTTVYCTTCQR